MPRIPRKISVEFSTNVKVTLTLSSNNLFISLGRSWIYLTTGFQLFTLQIRMLRMFESELVKMWNKAAAAQFKMLY